MHICIGIDVYTCVWVPVCARARTHTHTWALVHTHSPPTPFPAHTQTLEYSHTNIAMTHIYQDMYLSQYGHSKQTIVFSTDLHDSRSNSSPLAAVRASNRFGRSILPVIVITTQLICHYK